MSDETIRALVRAFRASPDDMQVASRLASAVSRSNDGKAFGIISIPQLGSKLTLVEPWTFTLFNEDRNRAFWQIVLPRVKPPGQGWGRNVEGREATLPAGTRLRVDRLYVRQGQNDFNSVTFICEALPPTSTLRVIKRGRLVGRFWVKLPDANKIVCEWDPDAIPREPIAAEKAAS